MTTHTYTLAKPITLPNGAILGKVEISELTGVHLTEIGDELQTVTRFFQASGQAIQRGELPTPAGSAEYRAMVSIIRRMTSLGDDAGEISVDDITGLVTSAIFGSDDGLGE